jgi:hypothetical protein
VSPKTPSAPPVSSSGASNPASTISEKTARQFEAYRPYTQAVLDRVWSTGTIALDANVLLHFYRIDERLRAAFFELLEDKRIADRLWFPHQVVAEFYTNRSNVIASQLRALEQLAKRATETLRSLPETKETPRFLIDREKLRAMLNETEKEVDRFLTEAKTSYPASLSKDMILERLSPILAPRTGGSFNDTDRAKYLDEGRRRLKERVPPGFLDADKPENGDYFVWAQCLEKCAREKRDLLLVTDDKKDDWWHRIHGYTIGPRPELRSEFHAAVPEADFVLAGFDTFLESISKYLSRAISATTLDDVREFVQFHQNLETYEDHDDTDWDELQERAVKHHRETAPTKDRDAKKSVDAMVNWFFERYEDPANGVPYDGREGGYQYVAGGPYDAEEELREIFEDGTKRMDRIINEAVRRIENSGSEWIRRGEY